MEEKILSMYAKGMTTGDIEISHERTYDIDISDSTISRITDKILPIVKEWQKDLWKKSMQLFIWMQSTIMCEVKAEL